MQLWQLLQCCHSADKIMILQGANTGLTGGSTPNGGYDRPVVVVNTLRLRKIIPIRSGRQVICFAGATLNDLERVLGKLGRQPHSVIGSTCIGASVVGGVCNNSGGALVERGPAYTEMALYARVDEEGSLCLENELGIDLGTGDSEVLSSLEREDVHHATSGCVNRKASDRSYVTHVRDISANTPARYNNDERCLFGASGCAGKLAVFAVRLDTFPKYQTEKTFYVGTNSAPVFSDLRREVLTEFKTLPATAEYLHRDAFSLAQRYGRDIVLAIRWLGAGRMAALSGVQSWLGAISKRLPGDPGRLGARLLQLATSVLPGGLPRRLIEWRNRFEHHLIIRAHDDGIDEISQLLSRKERRQELGYFECDARETVFANLNRYAAAGAAMRYTQVHSRDVAGLVSLDVALRRNDFEWYREPSQTLPGPPVRCLTYGHFLCNVFHHDYVVSKGHNLDDVKGRLLQEFEARGAEYPAEHNVGHLYAAKPGLAAFYRDLDPTNSFNSGIGGMSKKKGYSD